MNRYQETRPETGPALTPLVDIVENVENITVRADMPGVWKEAARIEVEGGTLTIDGEVSLGESGSLQGVYAEIRTARYRRSFYLGGDLDTERIEAAMKDGVLTVTIPKLEKAKPRKIPVRVG